MSSFMARGRVRPDEARMYNGEAWRECWICTNLCKEDDTECALCGNVRLHAPPPRSRRDSNGSFDRGGTYPGGQYRPRPPPAPDEPRAEGLEIQNDGTLSICLGRRCLNDQAVASWCSRAGPVLEAASGRCPGSNLMAYTVDLGENSFGDDGACALIELLERLRISVRVFRLYKNRLGSKGAEALAGYITRCPKAIEEIHLSHNLLDRPSADVLLGALLSAGTRGRPMYPIRDSRGKQRPIWVRLERNRIEGAEDLISGSLEDAYFKRREKHDFPIQKPMRVVCGAPDGCGCRAGHCNFQKPGFGPAVHLPHVKAQRCDPAEEASAEAHGASARTGRSPHPRGSSRWKTDTRSPPRRSAWKSSEPLPVPRAESPQGKTQVYHFRSNFRAVPASAWGMPEPLPTSQEPWGGWREPEPLSVPAAGTTKEEVKWPARRSAWVKPESLPVPTASTLKKENKGTAACLGESLAAALGRPGRPRSDKQSPQLGAPSPPPPPGQSEPRGVEALAAAAPAPEAVPAPALVVIRPGEEPLLFI